LMDAAGPPAGLGPMNRDLTRLLVAVDQSDTAPASEIVETFAGMCQDALAAISRWNDLRTQLTKTSLKPLAIPTQSPVNVNCGN